MRAVVLVMVFLGCTGRTLGEPCTSDASCTGDEVCSSNAVALTAIDTCTMRCGTTEFCVGLLGEGARCGKYVGPDSAGYACNK